MKLKYELAANRYHIMRLRARGISTKPRNYLHDEVKKLHDLCISVVRQRDDLAWTLDNAEAHIKFLEDKLGARETT